MKGRIVKGKAKPLGAYPHIKRVGDFIYVSGTSSRRTDNTHAGVEIIEGEKVLDIKIQTKVVIENINELLSAENASLVDVVDVTTFLLNMDDFKGYNEVYGSFFNSENGPTRTTVAVHQLPHPDLLIEIKVIVYKPI